ncbi:MAG: ATP-grasp domain-containing protein, partial [SAR324 cluster bacterium]|nr:ATP-grasp domain-containing protein [SAR324 cluster bacterium]
MFSKVLIANRGTIRAKCVQAVKELGAKAAVFYTDLDNMSHGVRMADEAYPLGLGEPTRAYYDSDRIVELAVRIGADAVHPGYGFLAENLDFAKSLAERNIKFIGPDEQTLARVTNKPLMKEEARKVGMKTIPASERCSDFARLKLSAKEIGYPLVLKPVSSSGGTGMTLISKESELRSSYDSFLNRSERFKLSIRDVFIEKYLEKARHIEFPVLRDSSGNMLILPEVEASIQRRFQKLLVETPSPFKDRNLIRELALLSRRLIDKLDYVGLASVEFIISGKNAYFN